MTWSGPADRRALVVIDLRVRAGRRHGTPLEVIGVARCKAMRRLGARWLAKHGMRYDQIRFDVVGLLQTATAGSPSSMSRRWADVNCALRPSRSEAVNSLIDSCRRSSEVSGPFSIRRAGCSASPRGTGAAAKLSCLLMRSALFLGRAALA